MRRRKEEAHLTCNTALILIVFGPLLITIYLIMRGSPVYSSLGVNPQDFDQL